MRQAFALSFGVLTFLVGHQCWAQGMPIFDEGNFEIASFVPGSGVIARSGGRDFFCKASVNDAAGYVLVETCLPFVNQGETVEADAQLATTVAANIALAAAAAVVEKDATAVELQEIASLTDLATDARLASWVHSNGCYFAIGTQGNEPPESGYQFAFAMGAKIENVRTFGPELLTKMRASVDRLVAAGRMTYINSGYTAALVECY